MYDTLTNQIVQDFDLNDEFFHELLEMYVSNYGEKYRDLIKKRLSSVCFDFSTAPSILKKSLEKYSNELSEIDKKQIQKGLVEYETWKEDFHYFFEYEFQYFLKGIFNTSLEIPISAFTNQDFSSGLIDSYSQYSEFLLSSKFAIPELKEKIQQEREEFKELLKKNDIDISNLDADKIQKIIERRNEENSLYKCALAKKCGEGEKSVKDIKNKYDYDIDDQDFKQLIFLPYAVTLKISQVDARIVRIPVLLMRYFEIDSMDEVFVHELIHCIEESNDLGIIDEVKVEKLAIKITNALHEKGLFLFDDPKNYGECNSLYELLFPLLSDFFEKHVEIFNECSIEGKTNLLETYFGDDWNSFSSDLEEIYACLTACHHRGFSDKLDLEKFQSYFEEKIQSMESYYKDSFMKII